MLCYTIAPLLYLFIAHNLRLDEVIYVSNTSEAEALVLW